MKKISVYIIILILIMTLSVIHIPIGSGHRTILIEYDINKKEYGSYFNGTWHSIYSAEVEHPIGHQVFFKLFERIKDRWPELIFV